MVIRASTRLEKFYFELNMVRYCPFWKMCATPDACIKLGCLARRPLCHKVNIPSSVVRWPLCHKVNLPKYEARRRHFIIICDIYGTGQTNSLALCFVTSPRCRHSSHWNKQIKPKYWKVNEVSRTHSTQLRLWWMIPLKSVKLSGVKNL